jgi:hypothetical protein
MRTLMVLAIATLLNGCTSSREKDCKAVLPIVDAAHADPSDENVAKLKAFTAQDAEVAAAVSAYTKKVERLNSGPKSVRELVAALKMKSDAGAFSMEMFDKTRPFAEYLVGRCMPAQPPPECPALSRALDACITPVKDDTTAEEQLLTCASGFAAVRSEDDLTNEAIQALATTIRDFEPFARNIGAPAKEVVRAAKEMVPKISDARKAGPEANLAEIDLRNLCARDRR